MELILTTPIKFAYKGQEEIGYKVTGTAPTAKSRNQLVVIKQTFFSALSQLQSKQAPNQDTTSKETQDEITGEMALMLLYSSNVDMTKFQTAMRELFTHGGVLKLEEVPMTPTLLDQMSFDDSEKLIGEYLKSFLLTSLVGQ